MWNGEEEDEMSKKNSFRSYYVNNYDDLLKNKAKTMQTKALSNGKSQYKGPKKFIYGQIAVLLLIRYLNK